MMKRLLGAGFVIAAILAAVAYYLSAIVKPPPSPESITPAVAKQALDRLNAAVKAPEPVSASISTASDNAPAAKTASAQPLPTPEPDIRVRFAEDDVNTMIQSNKDVQDQMQKIGATAADIRFSAPNIVSVTAWVNVSGMERQITIYGALTPDGNGGLTYQTDASKVGELPLPNGITADKLDSKAGKLLAMVEPVLPLKVHSVDVEGKSLVLTGPAKPGFAPPKPTANTST